MITEGSAQLPMLVTDDNIGNRMLVGPDLASAPIVYSANELNQYGSIVSGLGSQVLSYDLDGNCTNDGVFAYAWDAENRLTSVSSNGNVIASFKYDYMSRRYEKTAGDVTHSFIYDGWNLLEEQSRRSLGEGGSTTNYYTWGLDLSGSFQGAGGIGGLLSVTTCNLEPVTCYSLSDANGNITAYVDGNGAVVAHREYDAYGKTIAQTGSPAADFNLWFSSKYWDIETGLGYWGYRYYHPDEGRWLSRDPLGEKGAKNLYLAGLNAWMNLIDPTGLQTLGDYWYYFTTRLRGWRLIEFGEDFENATSVKALASVSDPNEAMNWAMRAFLVEGNPFANPNLTKSTLIANVVRIKDAMSFYTGAIGAANSAVDATEMCNWVSEAAKIGLASVAGDRMAGPTGSEIVYAATEAERRLTSTQRADLNQSRGRVGLYRMVFDEITRQKSKNQEFLSILDKIKRNIWDEETRPFRSRIESEGGWANHVEEIRGQKVSAEQLLKFLRKAGDYWGGGIGDLGQMISAEEQFQQNLAP